MQLDPGFPSLTLRLVSTLETKKYDELLSNFACFGFNCILRHYMMEYLLRVLLPEMAR